MVRKLLLSVILVFCSIITGDIFPSQQSKLPTPVFDPAKADHLNKNSSADLTPFWETTKKNNTIDTAALKQSNWYADVIRNIEASEYEIRKDAHTGLYMAPNRQQQLRASFTYNSFTLQPRSPGQDWKLRMQVSGIYVNKQLIAKPGENDLPVTGSNKIVFNNDYFSTEYINTKEGVRQNFIIQKEPANKPQTINIKLQTDKSWSINKVHDQELHFAKRQGDQLDKKITYNSLKVWDANNKELTAKFVVNKKQDAFEIEVNTVNAVYPITVDPLSSTPAAVLNGVNMNDGFGFSVASAGDVNGDGYSDVVVGAIGVSVFTGAAYVYLGSSTGLSTTPANILNGLNVGDDFGWSVASAGDVNDDGYSDIIIGAQQYDNAGDGVAYIFRGSSTGLSPTPATILNGISLGGAFGISVACAGDVNGDNYSDVVVGAYAVSAGTGAAYIYLGSSTGTALTPATILNGISSGDFFGASVAGAGDVNGDGYSDVVIGALRVASEKGAAYVFLGTAAGLSTAPVTTLNGIAAGDRFGRSVSCAGDVNGDGYSDVVIGAEAVASSRGSAYVFLGNSTGLSSSPATTLNGVNAGDYFGYSVASAGDVNGDGYSDVIVGAFFLASSQIGAAYVYLGTNTGLSGSPATILNGINTGDLFGYCVAPAGDINGDGYSDVIVGATGVSLNTGAAYTFHGGPDGLKTINDWQVIGADITGYFGWCVASAGDINSDGFSDVIVGAPGGTFSIGKAYLFMGSATGLSTTPAWTAIGTSNNSLFGISVAAAGDVNGDGYGDVLVGSIATHNPQASEGSAYLYYGSSGGLNAAAAWTYENNVVNSLLGTVAGAGDVNGDGYSDIIIGASGYNAGEGIVYVFYGRATIPDATPNWSVESNQIGCNFGASVASLGDVNGDGYSDIIIGSYSYDEGFEDQGKVFVYYGSSTGPSLTPNWTAKGNASFAEFGVSVSSAGDVNGDGFSDAIINGSFVFHGSATGLSPTPDWISAFGYSGSSAGDINGDGYSDILSGNLYYSNGQTFEGASSAYYGSSTGLLATSSWFVESNITNCFFGFSVASAGDINGDGYSDIIAGAPQYLDPDRNGAAFFYYGNTSTGLRNNLKLYNTDLVTPIGHLNVTEPNLFGAGLFSKSPLGRVKGKLVWEVKIQGQPFSGNPITNSTASQGKQPSFIDLGIAGIELKYNVQKPGFQNKIRVRVEYDKVTAITGQLYGPWHYPAAYLQGAHGMSSIPLPVKLNSFDGTLNAQKVNLQWSSSDDENVASYQIERSSDNRNFTAIGNVNSLHLNSNNYDFVDAHPLKGRSWYRLRITDEYKRINYSNTILIKNSTDAVLVYPTVLNKGEKINLQFKNNLTAILEIQLVNMNGVSVFKKEMTTNGTTLAVELPSLSPGVYILSVMQKEEKLITQKIIIR